MDWEEQNQSHLVSLLGRTLAAGESEEHQVAVGSTGWADFDRDS